MSGNATTHGGFRPIRLPLQAVPAPAGNEVHLWYLDLIQLGGSLQHALSDTPAGAAPARLSVVQLRFARRFYLRLLLGAYLGLPGKDVVIQRRARGKPVLDRAVHASPLNFSMAKSEDRLLIGISTSSHIGVDLEPQARRARHSLRLARRYFAPSEAARLAQLAEASQGQAFLRAWACKESVVKASGQGIANQLCRFVVEVDPDRPPALLQIDEDDASRWSIMLVSPDERFLGAVAMRQREAKITCFRLLAAAGDGSIEIHGSDYWSV